MRITLRPSRAQRGNMLMVTIVLTAIIGFALASYLTLVGSQRKSVLRSQVWNATIPLIEAGIEEAMAHLNENGVTNLFTQGWKQEYGYAVRRRKYGTGRYTVAITPTTRPLIECTGYLPTPINFAASDRVLLAQAGSTIIYRKVNYVFRTVRVTTGGGALFAKGMVAKDTIDFSGNNVSTDSFDSVDPNFSDNGRYHTSKRKDNGDVATNSKLPGMFNAGNANVRGHVSTGPGGSIIIGPNGTVGSLAWVNGGHSGIEPGYFEDDNNLSFPDVEVPFSGGFVPAGGIVNETNISYGTGLVTVVTLPDPLPAGQMTTNFGLITSHDYPLGPVLGEVTTNDLVETSTVFPTNALGAVITNTMIITTNSLPDPIPAEITQIVTNTVLTTSTTLPNPLPAGSIVTSAVPASLRYPYEPMPAGPPTAPPQWTPPAPGTFLGVVTNRYVSTGKSANRGWYHDYAAIASYTYYARTYAITCPSSYTYVTRTYTYSVPCSYTYGDITSTNITVTSDYYDYVLDTRDYQITYLTGKVYVRGQARLHVTGSINLTGHGCIEIGPQGSLQLYMSGSTAKIAGNGVINKSGFARNMTYYGLKSNTSLDVSGNGSFIGCIYAPYANLKLGGGGSDIQDFIGASVTATATMNGHFNFHYDEDLSRRGPRTRYIINSWNEVGPQETALLRNPEWVLDDEFADIF